MSILRYGPSGPVALDVDLGLTDQAVVKTSTGLTFGNAGAGVTGPPGATGATGPTGPTGASIQRVTFTVAVPSTGGNEFYNIVTLSQVPSSTYAEWNGYATRIDDVVSNGIASCLVYDTGFGSWYLAVHSTSELFEDTEWRVTMTPPA